MKRDRSSYIRRWRRRERAPSSSWIGANCSGLGGSVEERPNRLQRAALRPVETYFEANFRTQADGTTVINWFLGERAERLWVPLDRIILLRNGSEVRAPLMDRQAARRSTGLAADGPIIGCVGGNYSRDVELMARAFEWVRLAEPNARRLLVGYFDRDLAAMLGNADGVVRMGPQSAPQLSTFISAADICRISHLPAGVGRCVAAPRATRMVGLLPARPVGPPSRGAQDD